MRALGLMQKKVLKTTRDLTAKIARLKTQSPQSLKYQTCGLCVILAPLRLRKSL